MGAHAAVIEDVEVTRLDGDGRLRVTWRAKGEVDSVHLSWGSSPEGIDHAHALTVPADAGEAVLDLPARADGGRRVYVSLAPAGPAGDRGGATLAGERRLDLRGPVNFRDLGGYRTVTGRRVRWGLVYRSDALLLDDRDLVDFAGLGVRTVYDLRSDTERESVPNRLPEQDSPRVVVLPLVSEDPDANPLAAVESGNGEDFLEHLYIHILERSAANFGRVLSGLAEADELPAVFHCAAGKDRTGMVAAVLLSVLGVPLDVVLDDYELTSRYRTTEHVNASMARLSEARQMPPEVIAGILRAPRWAMQSALNHVAARHGDFDGYLTGPAGADPGVPGRLRELLLTP